MMAVFTSSRAGNSRDNYAVRLYRLLLRAYPRAFRDEYAAEMLLAFSDAYADTTQQDGLLGALSLWRDVVCDLATSLCVQHARNWMLRDEQNSDMALAGVEQAALALRMTLDIAQRSDVGRVRANNEDSLLSVVPGDDDPLQEKGALFVVSDGMGGHNVGEIASQLAVKTVRESYYSSRQEDISAALREAFQAANTALGQASADGSELGATCIAADLRDSTLTVANVGDSRAYVLHNGQLRQITRDHSLVAQMAERGEITPAEARTHAQRSLIFRSLGMPEVEVDCFVESVQEGDTLLLCTDGLSSVVEDAEIGAIVDSYGPHESVQRLIALANERGGPDNITAVVVQVGIAGQEYSVGQREGREDSEGAHAAD